MTLGHDVGIKFAALADPISGLNIVRCRIRKTYSWLQRERRWFGKFRGEGRRSRREDCTGRNNLFSPESLSLLIEIRGSWERRELQCRESIRRRAKRWHKESSNAKLKLVGDTWKSPGGPRVCTKRFSRNALRIQTSLRIWGNNFRCENFRITLRTSVLHTRSASDFLREHSIF